MMKSRTLLFVALLCALVLLVSSTWAAETTPQEQTKEDNVKEPDQYGGRCRYGCCGGGLYGRCTRCCRTADEAEAVEVSVGINGHGGGGWGGGGGGWGGGGGGWGGGGRGGGWGGGGRGGGWGGGGRGGGWGGGGGGGGGGHCRYGCCGGSGRNCRCCYSPEEAQAVEFGN